MRRDTFFDILWTVIDKPSIFSVIRNLGVRVSVFQDFDKARELAPMAVEGREFPAYELPVELRLNGALVDAFALSEGDSFMSRPISAADAFAQPGPNVLSLSLVGGDAQWTNFDYHRLDIRIVPEPSGGLAEMLACTWLVSPYRPRQGNGRRWLAH